MTYNVHVMAKLMSAIFQLFQEGESDSETSPIVTTTVTNSDVIKNGVLGTGNGVPGSSVAVWPTSTNTVLVPNPTVHLHCID